MAELVDALDLGSSAERRGGSSPSTRTILEMTNGLSPGFDPGALEHVGSSPTP